MRHSSFLKSKLVINIGIAWAADPEKHKLGDVLIANRVVNIDDVKRHQGQIIERSAIPKIDARSQAIVSTTKMRWADSEHKESKVHVGLYVGSNALLNDPRVKESILKRYPEAIGGEMESFAVYEAINFGDIPWMVIKGVSDFADGDKHDEYHEVATKNAARFVDLMCKSFRP